MTDNIIDLNDKREEMGNRISYIPKHSIEYEQSILSSLINSKREEDRQKIVSKIKTSVFYDTKHQIIYEAILEQHRFGAPTGAAEIYTILKDKEGVGNFGGAGYLYKLENVFPLSTDPDWHCERLNKMYEKRLATAEISKLYALATKDTTDIDSLRKEIFKFSQGEVLNGSNELFGEFFNMEISDEEWDGAQLSPACIAEDLFYADVGILVAAGGTGKSTQALYECIHIILGKDLYGYRVRRPGKCIYVTSEDPKGILIARMRKIAIGLGLSDYEMSRVKRGMCFIDVSGESKKLIEMDSGGNIVQTEFASEIAVFFKQYHPAMVIFDPAVSFGVGENKVNDNEQGLIMAARRIRNELGCCVRYIHHIGKANAREKSFDQYTGRGGSSMPDGARMVTVMQPWTPQDSSLRPPDEMKYSPDDAIMVMARPKLSYAKPNLPIIWIKRTGWKFEIVKETFVPEDQKDRDDLNKVERFLALKEKQGQYLNMTLLKSIYGELKPMSRDCVVDCVNKLIVQNRVENRSLPEKYKSTRRKDYLAVINPDAAGLDLSDVFSPQKDNHTNCG